MKIIWDKFNLEHIRKHNVSREEVEKLANSQVKISEGYSGRKILTTKVGQRILSVVVNFEDGGIYVITARDASMKERQDYYEYEKNKENKI